MSAQRMDQNTNGTGSGVNQEKKNAQKATVQGSPMTLTQVRQGLKGVKG